jgi:hypothetical protein
VLQPWRITVWHGYPAPKHYVVTVPKRLLSKPLEAKPKASLAPIVPGRMLFAASFNWICWRCYSTCKATTGGLRGGESDGSWAPTSSPPISTCGAITSTGQQPGDRSYEPRGRWGCVILGHQQERHPRVRTRCLLMSGHHGLPDGIGVGAERIPFSARADLVSLSALVPLPFSPCRLAYPLHRSSDPARALATRPTGWLRRPARWRGFARSPPGC